MKGFRHHNGFKGDRICDLSSIIRNLILKGENLQKLSTIDRHEKTFWEMITNVPFGDIGFMFRIGDGCRNFLYRRNFPFFEGLKKRRQQMNTDRYNLHMPLERCKRRATE